MPILDPALQHELGNLTQKQKSNHKSKFCFYTKYLKIASKNIYKTADTFKNYIQFKNNFAQHFPKLDGIFKFDKESKEAFKDTKITDYYKYLLDLIPGNSKEEPDNDGNNFLIHSMNLKYNFFQPFIKYSRAHLWYFCDSPVAILCLKFDKFKMKHFYLANLEADLLAAAGFSLILIISDADLYIKSEDELITKIVNFIKDHHFLEIHLNFQDMQLSYDIEERSVYRMLNWIYSNYDKLNSYFYLYSSAYEHCSQKIDILYKLLKTKARFKLVCFGDSFRCSLKKCKVENLNEKVKYNIDGFTSNKIKIFLCDVPLYDSDDDNNNKVPINFAFFDDLNNEYYIERDEFIHWKKDRVQVKENLYVDFDDIHYLNPDLFVKHTMYLSKVGSYELITIDSIIENSEKKYEHKKNISFKKEFFITLFTESKAKTLLSYVLYAYKMMNKKFEFKRSQVYVAYKTIDFCIKHRFSKDNYGFVYQVATGEGKSAIVKLIAAVLALFGKTVHVVTSNIVLAKRDYIDSLSFFKKLGLTSAALIHENEISENDDSKKKKYFPDEFFHKDLFKNSMGMNFDACGVASDKGKADIIFSNLINFESMYLHMSEKYPARVQKYYKNSSLVIDEADLILIDELTNGTILSRSIKSNSEEILTYIYNCRCESKEITSKKIYDYIIEHWPDCSDITIEDIEIMFKEIDMVNEDKDFIYDKRYALLPISSSNNDDKKSKSKIIQKEVIPFNFDHTGLLERNKEFGGFVQQFIALKERKLKKNIKPNENLIVKEVSINYLYISHPIYVSLYNNVCGLTGTIGNESDKEIFHNHYHLQTRKVPKENPNRRYEFPIILCENEKERNKEIVEEIMAFHKKGNPVLAIFQSPSDIDIVKDAIEQHKDFQSNKVNIGIYNGKMDIVKPNKDAGAEGAISLGTNVCGRGTHIDIEGKSLHVICTFYTTNKRAMNQAYGRTSRQNNFGTVRTICLINEFIREIIKMNDTDRENSIKMLDNVNNMQNKFIEYFRQNRKWIFDINIQAQKIPNQDIIKLRSNLLNVNRINAYNFRFPFCMNYKTFLKIQAQKIFSLYNCPNSVYTWRLFQQYIREMILESWSLFLNQMERNFYYNPCPLNEYFDKFRTNLITLIKELRKYLPTKKDKLDIVPTFMHIFNKVEKIYNPIILPIYIRMMPDDNTEENKTVIKPRMSMIKIGFRPYTLSFKSGSKIYSLVYNEEKISYIEDPELKYQRRGSNNILSITEKIDNIFESICNFFSRLIGNKIGFKFFLRRTLGGCEFGICYDFDLEFDTEEIQNLKNCLIDRDPLFVFSISVKSMVPFLAGVLIFFLLYLANIAKQIVLFIQDIPKLSLKFAKKVVIELAKHLAEKAFGEFEDRIVGKLCDYLKDLLTNQINKFKKTRNSYYLLFKLLSDMLIDKIPDAADKIYEKVGPKIKINTRTSLGKIAANGMEHIFKIGFLLVLCVASFMINFQIDKSIPYDNESVASQLTEKENYKDKTIVDDYVQENEKIFNKKIPKIKNLK